MVATVENEMIELVLVDNGTDRLSVRVWNGVGLLIEFRSTNVCHLYLSTLHDGSDAI